MTVSAARSSDPGLDGKEAAAPGLAARIEGWRRRVAGLAGWRRWATAYGLGVLAVFALPPIHALPLLVPSFAGLCWLIEGSGRGSRGFATGWWFGFGFFTAGLYWIAFALLIDAERFAWMVPFAVFGLSAGFAVYAGLAAAGAARLGARGMGGALVLASLWTAAEWLRGWAFTGFPWNLIGTVWVVSDGMIQAAAVVGVHGLGLITVAVAAMPAALGDGGVAWRRRVGIVATSFAALAAIWVAGVIRLGLADAGTVEGVRLRLVQPNIAQSLKWRPELRVRHIETQIAMSRAAPAPGEPPPTHVIWAETMVPFFLSTDPDLLRLIGAAAPEGGLAIVGAPRTEGGTGAEFRVWNSLHAVTADGRLVATYDKAHLTPFGEYVPFRQLLRFAKVTEGRGDFSPGPGLATLALPGLPPASPLICYEVIFSGAVVAPGPRPGWLLNITNDGWFGRSPGPHQHFAAARLRAVEEGLPLVRVANTGISAIVDAQGRVRAMLRLGARGVVDGDLPRPLAIATPFTRFGEAFLWALILSGLAFGVFLKNNRAL